MAKYDYHRLSPTDFEMLASDLLGAELGVKFERFAEGRDGGVDFRHTFEDGRVIIGQAKRYQNTNSLIRKIGTELAKLGHLEPTRYVLVTSCSLTAANKLTIAEKLSPWSKEGDIWGAEHLDDLLAQHPEVLRRNFKLWLGDSTQLSLMFNNGLHQRTQAIFNSRIKPLVENFVSHQAVLDVVNQLNEYGYCLVTGDPGIGKTSLAGYVVMRELTTDPNMQVLWISDRRIDSVLQGITPGQKTFIVLDDFLGATFLSPESSVAFAEDLNAILALAKAKPHELKVILTSRDYLLAQANWQIDELQSGVGSGLRQACVKIKGFSYRVRGEIFYNLVRISRLTEAQRLLWQKDRLFDLVLKHKNFNPRLLALLLNELAEQNPKELRAWIQSQLDCPKELWRQPFRRLSPAAQCLLYCVGLSPNVACVSDLTRIFYGLYRKIHGQMPMPGALEAALLEVEPNFAVTQSHCAQVWIGFSNGGVEDLVIGLVAENPLLIEALIECIDIIDLGLYLFSCASSDNKPIALNNERQLQLFTCLVRVLDRGKLNLVQRQTNVQSLEERWEIKTSSFGANLSALWSVGRLSQVKTELVNLLDLILMQVDWGGLCKQAQTDVLLDMLESFPQYQESGWTAIRDSMLDSADAAAIAVMCRYNERAAEVFLAKPKKLLGDMDDVCFREIERASDEFHIGAVLEDIETIEEMLDVELPRAKWLGREKLENIFSGEAEDHVDVDYYEKTEADDFLEWMQLTQPEDVMFVESLFSEFEENSSIDH